MTLRVENLTGYNQIPVLKDLNFTINDGELVALIGLNGAGKSTTIKEIIGLLQPQQGRIELDGLTINKDPESYRSKIGYIPESPLFMKN